MGCGRAGMMAGWWQRKAGSELWRWDGGGGGGGLTIIREKEEEEEEGREWG